MSLSLFARNALVCGCLAVAAPAVVFGQTNSTCTNGVEYAIAGSLPGDQVHPQLGLNPSGGYLVWEDNITDGDGLGISALRLDSSFSGGPRPLPGERDRRGRSGTPASLVAERRRGGLCLAGRAAGLSAHLRPVPLGGRHLGEPSDVLRQHLHQQLPGQSRRWRPWPTATWSVAWASFNQVSANSLQDVYAQVLSPAGQKLGGEFLVNQFTSYNQRTPGHRRAERRRFRRRLGLRAAAGYRRCGRLPSVDVYARIFNASGVGRRR